VTITEEMRSAIDRRIEEYLSSEDPRLEWVRAAAREHTFLPLYVGWLSTLGIRPDGSWVRWDHEDDPTSIKPLSNLFLQRMALCEGRKKFPELGVLLPQRPASAHTCEVCGGTGELRGPPEVICHCGGIGWVIPGEDTGAGIG
jgi:hypothetical protein